ncbi:MAG: hypothetical protein Q7R45_15635 [Sulfuricaulis sp.]|nr:hypothetical protein [Sulfuricaulis sp.]
MNRYWLDDLQREIDRLRACLTDAHTWTRNDGRGRFSSSKKPGCILQRAEDCIGRLQVLVLDAELAQQRKAS